MIWIDELSCRSGLRHVNTGEKFFYTIATLLICVASRSYWVSAAAFAANGFLTVAAGRIPLSCFLRMFRIPVLFLILGSGAVLLNVSSVPMDAFAIPLGEWYITGSQASVGAACRLFASAMAAVSCLYFLALNTTMPDILAVLGKLHLPLLFTELMMLIYRFVFILLATGSAVMTAQEARLGDRNFRTRIRSFGGMGISLFLRSMKRSGEIYDAMEARCYDGRIRVLEQESPPLAGEIAGILLFEAVLVFLALLTGGRI